MARSFRQRQFGGRSGLGEDVNPSAYIVNLADCMLVLACGVIVALVAYFNIDLTGVTKLKSEQMKPIDPHTMPEEIGTGGTSYVEAGVVYMDPTTGELYMVEGMAPGAGANAGTGADTGADAGSGSEDGSDAAAPADAATDAGAENEAAGNAQDVQNARANGAD